MISNLVSISVFLLSTLENCPSVALARTHSASAPSQLFVAMDEGMEELLSQGKCDLSDTRSLRASALSEMNKLVLGSESRVLGSESSDSEKDDVSLAATKAANKKRESGAQKKKKRQKVRDSTRVAVPERRSDSSDGSSSDESSDPICTDVPVKTCAICGRRSTEPDPVAEQRAKRRRGKKKKRSTTLRWERKGAACYYCSRVHERRYSGCTRKELKAKLKEKDEDGNFANKDQFEVEREKAVEILIDNTKIGSEFGNMAITNSLQRVVHEHKKLQRKSKRGKIYRQDVFAKRFPHLDPQNMAIFYWKGREDLYQSVQ